MYFHIIASGSKGNATLIVTENTKILIDIGITKKRLLEGLKEVNVSLSDIDALLITHNHTDHVHGIKFISPKLAYGLPKVVPSLGNEISLFEPFNIKGVKITPIEASHDANDCCGYILEDNTNKLVYLTDTGIACESIFEYTANPDYLIIESNHDIQMLMATNRTMECKERILSYCGHLCNEDSAFATLRIIGDKTKEIVLAHISEEANTPEKAIQAYQKIFNYKGVNLKKYNLRVTNQWKSLTGGDIPDEN